MSDPNADWLFQKLIDENAVAYRTVWYLYLKFYTVFKTVNIAALAFTVEYVSQNARLPIVIAFAGQNIISGVTAFQVSEFSARSARQFKRTCGRYIDKNEIERRRKGIAPQTL